MAKKKEYLVRTYDTYWNDVVRSTIVSAIDDDTVVRIARTWFDILVCPSDRMELQVCRKDTGSEEWFMFAAIYYDDDSIVVEECGW